MLTQPRCRILQRDYRLSRLKMSINSSESRTRGSRLKWMPSTMRSWRKFAASPKTSATWPSAHGRPIHCSGVRSSSFRLYSKGDHIESDDQNKQQSPLSLLIFTRRSWIWEFGGYEMSRNSMSRLYATYKPSRYANQSAWSDFKRLASACNLTSRSLPFISRVCKILTYSVTMRASWCEHIVSNTGYHQNKSHRP